MHKISIHKLHTNCALRVPWKNKQSFHKRSLATSQCNKSDCINKTLEGNEVSLSAVELEEFHSHGPEDSIETFHINMKAMRKYLSGAELKQIILASPKVLLLDDLTAWFEFLTQYGFSEDQISCLLCQAPQALEHATLVSAGEAMTAMRQAGMDEGSIKAFVVNYPQLLHNNTEQIAYMLRTLSRFSSGINC